MGLLDAYRESLPEGTRSFGSCRVRQDAFDIIAQATEEADPSAYRELKREWLPGGDPPSGWIPEAYANCLCLLFRDTIYASDESCLEAFRRNNDELFKKPVYRVIMFVLSPTLAIMGAEKRWSTFRQGTTLRADGLRKDGPDHRTARILLDYPPGLYEGFLLKMVGTGIECAANAAGARDLQMQLTEECRPGHAVWSMRYA